MYWRRSILIYLAAAVLVFAADSPFVGQWRLNPAKSQFAGISTTFTKLPSGKMFMSSEGQSYEFRMDGKEFRAGSGVTVTWTQVDDHTWLTVYKNQGMRTTETTKLSADGQTLTVVSQGTKPNGEKFEETYISQRLSGGPGLVGQWKTTQMKPLTQVWNIEPDGEGLTVNLVDFHAACSLKFDGKSYPVNGPTVPLNYTLSMKKTGPRSLEISEKLNGKTVYTDAFSVSADGKTLTTEGAAPGSGEKTRAVYDRQ